MSPVSAIRMENIWTRFGDKSVHEDINLSLAQSEILGLVGASGSGKTTLMREMIGLQVPTRGRVYVMGNVLDFKSGAASKQMLTQCGVLFQKGALFSSLNVFDNIAFPLRELSIVDTALITHLVMLKLSMVGLSCKDASLMPSELSGGMVKRVALARALILEPKLLFLDEPTSGLDPVASQGFVDLLRELHHDLSFTVVMVTHDLNVLNDLCTKVAVLAEKKLIAYGPLEVALKSNHSFARLFFHNKHAEKVFSRKS
ncbi:MAG: ATP-binding cassette domain-containing protein [Methylomicrobium sp.]